MYQHPSYKARLLFPDFTCQGRASSQAMPREKYCLKVKLEDQESLLLCDCCDWEYTVDKTLLAS